MPRVQIFFCRSNSLHSAVSDLNSSATGQDLFLFPNKWLVFLGLKRTRFSKKFLLPATFIFSTKVIDDLNIQINGVLEDGQVHEAGGQSLAGPHSPVSCRVEGLGAVGGGACLCITVLAKDTL